MKTLKNEERKYRYIKSQKPLILASTLSLFLVALIIINGITRSIQISLPVAMMLSTVPTLFLNARTESRRREFENLWPETLDLIISGIQSGLSLPQTLISLSDRGPQRIQRNFHVFSQSMKSGISFESSISRLKKDFSHPLSDQVCEVLRIAQNSGSRNTSLTLRTYADFVSSDLALNEEIRAKHSWIRNSALLASVTPWFLLVLLSSQENARSAYSSAPGFIVLMAGVFLTIIAYFWMSKVGKIASAPRIFRK